MSEYMTIRDAGDVFPVSVSAVRSAIKEGSLPSRWGDPGRYEVRRSDLVRWLSRRLTTPAQVKAWVEIGDAAAARLGVSA